MDTQTQIGTIISQDIPQIASIIAELGFDFIFIDLEHGNVSDNTIASIINSMRDQCKIYIRIREIKEATIKHALDLGCDGLIAPRVETAEELQTFVDYSYYPPTGKRSVGFSLANKFGANFHEYKDDFKPILLAQIESTQGLQLANEILSKPLIDGLFMGPYDLSLSMSIPGEFNNPKFLEPVKKIRTSCKLQNKLFGTFAINNKAAQNEIAKGCNLLAIGTDSNILIQAYQDILGIKRH